MTMPRLVVTREQAERIAKVAILQGQRPDNTVTLTERPMMPCPQCDWHRDHGEQTFGWRCPFCYVEGSGNTATVPVPVGTRVEVGWDSIGHGGAPIAWHPVATATVAEVLFLHGAVQLTDIEAIR